MAVPRFHVKPKMGRKQIPNHGKMPTCDCTVEAIAVVEVCMEKVDTRQSHKKAYHFEMPILTSNTECRMETINCVQINSRNS